MVQFDLSSIPSHAVINSATMKFHSTSPSKMSPVGIFKNTESWEEDTVTFNNRPLFNSNPLQTLEYITNSNGKLYFTGDSTISDSDTGFLKFSGNEITTLVQSWVDGSTSNYGVSIKATGDPASDYGNFFFGSKEWSDYAPELIINFTVTPK